MLALLLVLPATAALYFGDCRDFTLTGCQRAGMLKVELLIPDHLPTDHLTTCPTVHFTTCPSYHLPTWSPGHLTPVGGAYIRGAALRLPEDVLGMVGGCGV